MAEPCPAAGSGKIGGFPATYPKFVVEILSPSDRLPTTQANMEEYLANGAQLGFRLDVEAKTVYIYRPREGLRPGAEWRAGTSRLPA